MERRDLMTFARSWSPIRLASFHCLLCNANISQRAPGAERGAAQSPAPGSAPAHCRLPAARGRRERCGCAAAVAADPATPPPRGKPGRAGPGRGWGGLGRAECALGAAGGAQDVGDALRAVHAGRIRPHLGAAPQMPWAAPPAQAAALPMPAHLAPRR